MAHWFMRARNTKALVPFLLELAVYGVFVTAYFLLVLHFLGTWLTGLYERNQKVYAVTALILIVCQGLLLEIITTRLLRWIRSRLD